MIYAGSMIYIVLLGLLVASAYSLTDTTRINSGAVKMMGFEDKANVAGTCSSSSVIMVHMLSLQASTSRSTASQIKREKH